MKTLFCTSLWLLLAELDLFGQAFTFRDVAFSGNAVPAVAACATVAGARTTLGALLNVGDLSGYENRAGKMTNIFTGTICAVELCLTNRGSPSGVLTVRLYSDNAGAPGTVLATSDTLSAATVSGGWLRFTISGTVTSSYWVGLSNSVVNSVNYVQWWNNGSFLSVGDKTSADGSTWTTGGQRGMAYKLFSQ